LDQGVTTWNTRYDPGDHIDVAVTEPTSPTIGLDVMNMQGTKDENETLASPREATDKQIKGIRVVEVQAADVQLKFLDWMIDSKDNEQEMMVSEVKYEIELESL
ncbi:unnamed protein product, partial [Prunus brigantina]